MKKILAVIFMLAMLGVAALCPQAFGQGQFILNGGFEDIVAGRPPVAGRNPDGMRFWMRWTFTSNERSDQFSREGQYSFKLFGNGGAYQDFLNPIKQSKTYKASCYMLTPADNSLSGGAFVVLKLEWLTRLRRTLHEQTIESRHFDGNMEAGKWHLISVEGQPPRDAKYGRVTIEYRGAARDGAAFADEVTVAIVEQDKIQDSQPKKEQQKKQETEPAPDDEIDWQW